MAVAPRAARILAAAGLLATLVIPPADGHAQPAVKATAVTTNSHVLATAVTPVRPVIKPPRGVFTHGVFTGVIPVSAFAHAEAFTPPYELQIVNNPNIQRTANFPVATVPNPQIIAHNPWIEFDFIVAPNIDAYINPVGGLTRVYDTIGWVGDIYTEACLTANEAKLWPGAVAQSFPQPDSTCPSLPNATNDAFVTRAWYQVADAKADLYVVQHHGFVNIPTKVMVNVQQADVPLRFHVKGSQLYYTNAHTGPNNPAVCPGGSSCPPVATDLRTGIFDTVVLPAALIQLKVLPQTIVYLPPGSKSFGSLKVTKTYGATISAGEISQIDNTDSQDTWIEHTTSTSATGGILKIVSFGYNDTSDSKFDTKTSLKTSQAVERDVSNAIQQSIVFTQKMTAGPLNVPGATGAFDNAPFWNDLVVVLAHPQLAVWDFFGRKQVQLIAAVNATGTTIDGLLAQPDDVAISVGELDTCAHGTPHHILMPSAPDEILNPTECLSLAQLDPFYGKGQSADLSARGQLLKNSQEYGLLQGHSAGEHSIDLQETLSDTLSQTDSNTASYAATVEDILATSQSTGITLGGGSGPVVPVIDLGLSQVNTLKQGSTLDSATTMNLTYKNSTATSFRTDVTVEGSIDDNTQHLPNPPQVEIWQDDAFGGLMFRDPDAPTH